jgi:hypothetical protein
MTAREKIFDIVHKIGTRRSPAQMKREIGVADENQNGMKQDYKVLLTLNDATAWDRSYRRGATLHED